MQAAPDDEREAGAVPQSANEHCGGEIEIAPGFAAPVAAQRDVEIVAQEARQRDVPPMPEFGDAFCLVGRIEIERQNDAEQERHADSHVAIAGKIEIDLQRIGERPAPRLEPRDSGFCRRGKNRIGNCREIVGDHRFLEQPDREDSQADRQPIGRQARLGNVELRHHFAMMHDRSGDQVRKVSDKENVLDEAPFVSAAEHDIGQVGDLRKCKEGNAERQRYRQWPQRLRREVVEYLDSEIGIFVETQRRKVCRNRDDEGGTGISRISGNRQRKQKIGDNRDADDRQEIDVPVCVESKRRQRQPDDAGHRRFDDLPNNKEACQCDRQEHEDELERVEEHANVLCRRTAAY